MTTSDLGSLQARVAELERRQRTLRRFALGALCLLPERGRTIALPGGPVVRHLE